ncbi:molybdate ABC transporter substrate-binding protein [Hydrogenispora ethanolica]|nr:molybdate ABC transporter substrate-binding protein [Hydrogenispora ethanolica]
MMKHRGLVLIGMLVLLLGATAGWAAPKADLYVSAAASLKDALLEMEKPYEAKHDVRLIFNFNSSGALQTQIEQGAPADVFVSAALKQMDNLEKKDLIKKGTRRNLLENEIVMVVPRDANINLKDFKDLALASVKRIGIGAPASVPAGQYALEAFKKLGLWDKIQDKAVYGTNVRAVLSYVETGNVDAGIVYRTDAAISDKVKVAAAAPAGSTEPVIYPAAVLAGTKQPKEAAEYLAFLSGPEAKLIFEKYGFVVK